MTQNLKKKTELLTKDVERRTAYAISAFMGDNPPSAVLRRKEARTVISAYVINRPMVIAAQRLLSWECIDAGVPEKDLCEVSKAVADPHIRAAHAGYFFLDRCNG